MLDGILQHVFQSQVGGEGERNNERATSSARRRTMRTMRTMRTPRTPRTPRTSQGSRSSRSSRTVRDETSSSIQSIVNENSPLLVASASSSNTTMDNHRSTSRNSGGEESYGSSSSYDLNDIGVEVRLRLNSENDDGDDSNEYAGLLAGLDISSAETADMNGLEAQPDTQSNTNSNEENENDVDLDDNDSNNNNTDNRESAVDFLSRTRRRLHCLFIFFTCPIIPLVSALAFFLVWLLYAAFFGDDGANCAQPLRSFATISTCLFLYTPYHKKMRRFLSLRYRSYNHFLNSNNSSSDNNSNSNSNNNTTTNSTTNDTTTNNTTNEPMAQQQTHRSHERDPAIERIYDHIYLSLCLFYIYLGVTWIENCRSDDTLLSCTELTPDTTSTIHTTSTSSLSVTSIAASVYSASSSSCDDTCGCPHLYHATRSFVMTLCILAAVLVLPLLCLPCVYVWIVRGATEDALEAAARGVALGGIAGLTDDGQEGSLTRWTVAQVLDQMELVFRNNNNDLDLNEKKESRISDDVKYPKECCICMTEFVYSPYPSTPTTTIKRTQGSKHIIRTKCGHVFHRDCLGGWLGGQWDNSMDNDDTDNNDNYEDHVGNHSNLTTNNNNRSNRRNMRVRATRRVCPLCRECLIPDGSPPSSP